MVRTGSATWSALHVTESVRTRPVSRLQFQLHSLHTIGRAKQGPDLATVASDPTHTPEWFGEYIRNPKSQKPDSRMPQFMGKISDDDFKALIEYLSSLK